MKSTILGLLAVGLLSGPMAANAAPITYVLETALNDGSDVGTFQGFITFDSADVFASNTVSASSFIDWAFSWGTESVAAGGSAGFSPGSDQITFDAFSQITTWAICVTTPGNCGSPSFPGFYSDSNGELYFASPSGGIFNTGVEQAWTVASVPEPGTLALLGLGLAGLGVTRRKAA